MERKNLCALIPLDLHQRVSQGKEASDCQTLGDYITEVLTAYYDYIEHKGESSMNGTKNMGNKGTTDGTSKHDISWVTHQPSG